jgi:hypothetical protein
MQFSVILINRCYIKSFTNGVYVYTVFTLHKTKSKYKNFGRDT